MKTQKNNNNLRQNTWNVHPSQVQLRIANLWKGAFKSELLLQVGVEIINFIAAAVNEAAIKKRKSAQFKKSQAFFYFVHLLKQDNSYFMR